MSRRKLDLEEGVLFRQVHPTFMRDGRASRQAFRPTKKDEGFLSVARSTLTTAQGAYHLHTVGRELQSVGTWGITVQECAAEELSAYEAPLECPPEKIADPAHAVVDFNGFSNGQREAKAVGLARAAEARRRLYPPPDDDPKGDDIPF